MKKVKKLSALLLSLCMAFVFVASTAFAAEQVADAMGLPLLQIPRMKRLPQLGRRGGGDFAKRRRFLYL